MDDGIELRHLRYFVAVAEEAHFGRAAERLFIAQPSLSYAIRQLESRLDVELVDRSDRRNIALTDAGDTLLTYAREVLHGVTTAIDATRAVGRDRKRQLRIGYNDGEPLARRSGLLGAATRRPDLDVTFRRLNWGTEGNAVRTGVVDAVLARLPIDTRGLESIVVHTEPRIACLPSDHRLAARKNLTMRAIRNEPVVRPTGGSAEWVDFWRGLPRPDGSTPPDGPETFGPDDTFDTVAAGSAICFVPASMADTIDHETFALLPVDGLAPVDTAVVWSRRRRRPIGLDDFIVAARTLLSG